MRRSLAAVAVLALVAIGPLHAQHLDSARARLEERIAASGATVGLYVRDLEHADSLALGADLRFHAASTMKVPVMIQVYRDADAGRLRLDDQLTVTPTFASIADSSTYTLDMADDSDSSLYRQVGRSVTIGELVRLMITVSSNLATNNLIARVGPDRVQATVLRLGADSMVVRRGVEDDAAYAAGLNNTTTARALGAVMASIANGEAASAASCGEMLEVLLRQRFRDGIPAGLPRRTRVAHKTGWTSTVDHDAGVVYVRGRPRYVIVVLTRGLADRTASAQLIADLTRIVHATLVPARG